jgi:hypothetical protein
VRDIRIQESDVEVILRELYERTPPNGINPAAR